jgi:hypothetical protein
MKWLLLAIGLGAWSKADADCGPSSPALQMQFHSATFTCEVLRLQAWHHDERLALVRVLRSWKGVRPGSTVSVSGALFEAEGIVFERGKRYIVYANPIAGGILLTDQCAGTHELSDRGGQGELDALGPSLPASPRWWWWGKP